MRINHIDVNNLKIFDQVLAEDIPNLISLNDLQSIVSHCKELVLYGKIIKQKLDRLGFVIIKLCNLHDLDEKQRNNLFLLFCLSVGHPTEHNLNKRDYIWEIQPRKNISYASTFSEHNLEASLHTDTQYHLNPEKYISLLTIKQAICGGGKTILLDFYEVLKTLQETDKGRICLKILQDSSFPFAVPTVFAEDKLNQEVIYSHIISNDFTIRYRYDTIYKGLIIANIAQTDIRYWALSFFENHLAQHPQQKLFYLPENHIIFINNYRFLHGRTSFQDITRYLLRVRLN
jgi:alpha-ketoglutarate-dependent taurine dioxygenase